MKKRIITRTGGKERSMDSKIYLNFGVYKEQLFKAEEGSFASTAWLKSDEAFNDIAGTSFTAITADDCMCYNLGKYNVRRLESMEEFNTLLEKAHPAFKRLVELFNLDEKVCTYREAEMYDRMAKKFGSSSKYSTIYGVHEFTRQEDGSFTHEFAIFNDNKSGLDSKVFEEFRETLPTEQAAFDEAKSICTYLSDSDFENELEKGNKFHAFEFYCD